MKSNELTIGLIQADIVWEDHWANLTYMEGKLQELESTDLIVLPEMFTTGFSMEPGPVAQSMDGPSVAWMRNMAEQRNTDILGSMIIAADSSYYNRLVWIKPDGRIFTYDKKHLFSFAGEHRKYSPGNRQLIVNVNGWKLAPFICYDLRFPVWSRNHGEHYDVALYIASWPEKRAAHWQTLLRARAIENQVYVVGLNRVGKDGNGIDYSGDSMVIDPLGDVLFHSRHDETVHRQNLLADRLDTVRESFPFLKDADAFKLVD